MLRSLSEDSIRLGDRRTPIRNLPIAVNRLETLTGFLHLHVRIGALRRAFCWYEAERPVAQRYSIDLLGFREMQADRDSVSPAFAAPQGAPDCCRKGRRQVGGRRSNNGPERCRGFASVVVAANPYRARAAPEVTTSVRIRSGLKNVGQEIRTAWPDSPETVGSGQPNYPPSFALVAFDSFTSWLVNY
jgi:hypothetical protein